jgi:transcription antitermination factor NusA-like protein
MARGPLSFKQSDLTRAIKGALAAGLRVRSVEIDKDGKIVVVTVKPDEGKSASLSKEIVL